jgi:hypothetical protein
MNAFEMSLDVPRRAGKSGLARTQSLPKNEISDSSKSDNTPSKATQRQVSTQSCARTLACVNHYLSCLCYQTLTHLLFLPSLYIHFFIRDVRCRSWLRPRPAARSACRVTRRCYQTLTYYFFIHFSYQGRSLSIVVAPTTRGSFSVPGNKANTASSAGGHRPSDCR